MPGNNQLIDFSKVELFLNDSTLETLTKITIDKPHQGNIVIHDEEFEMFEYIQYIQKNLDSLEASTQWIRVIDQWYLNKFISSSHVISDSEKKLIDAFFQYDSILNNVITLKVIYLLTYQHRLDPDVNRNKALVKEFIEGLKCDSHRLKALINATRSGLIDGFMVIEELTPDQKTDMVSEAKIAEQLNYLAVEISNAKKYPNYLWVQETLYKVSAQLGNGYAQANLAFTLSEKYKVLFWAKISLKSNITLSRRIEIHQRIEQLANSGYELTPFQYQEYYKSELLGLSDDYQASLSMAENINQRKKRMLADQALENQAKQRDREERKRESESRQRDEENARLMAEYEEEERIEQERQEEEEWDYYYDD